MKQSEMIARYIHAAARRLPSKIRDDVKLELESIISDMLEQRCGDLEPSEQDVRLVLTELGTPWELAGKYRGNGAPMLLDGAYYHAWRLVVTIVLLCFGFGLTIAFGVQLFTEQPVGYQVLGQWLGGLLTGGMAAVGFVTVMFMIFQEKKVPIPKVTDFLDDLPPVPDKKLTIPAHEAVIDLVLNGVFVLIFLVFPQILVAIFENGHTITVFSLPVLRTCWPWIIGMAALGIFISSMELVEGRHTRRLVVVATAAQLLTVILAGFWLFTPGLINPELLLQLSNMFAGEEFLVQIFSHITQLLFAVIAVANLLEMGMRLWKLRYID